LIFLTRNAIIHNRLHHHFSNPIPYFDSMISLNAIILSLSKEV